MYMKILHEYDEFTLIFSTRSFSGQSPIAMIRMEMEVIPDFTVAKRSIINHRNDGVDLE